jgi:hypothetical protein
MRRRSVTVRFPGGLLPLARSSVERTISFVTSSFGEEAFCPHIDVSTAQTGIISSWNTQYGEYFPIPRLHRLNTVHRIPGYRR